MQRQIIPPTLLTAHQASGEHHTASHLHQAEESTIMHVSLYPPIQVNIILLVRHIVAISSGSRPSASFNFHRCVCSVKPESGSEYSTTSIN
ncbi:hypothetical protein AVEN_258444-1 [Araneus ventricosus]|uniref:Uncharacterized protein n=1 Tax=Araneus ventricosus TaxID=182803 RepID=A0A4Y2DGH9_ARAVE|nr:hypothetical protein AVEN_258444-1 [Araneus ventricosus]